MINLDRKRELVISSIAAQHREVNKSVFVYKISKLYGVEPLDEIEILKNLADAGDIELDYVDTNLHEESASSLYFKWKNGYDWLFDYIALYTDPIDYTDMYFIKTNADSIHVMKEKYSSHHALLRMEDGTFFVECDGKEYEMQLLKTGDTLDIVEFAYKRIGQTITRKMIFEHLPNISFNIKKSLRSNKFQNSTLVKEILMPFIALTADSIRIKKEADLKYDELEMIRSSSVREADVVI